MVKMLIEHDATLSAKDKKEHTAMFYAIQNKNQAIKQILSDALRKEQLAFEKEEN